MNAFAYSQLTTAFSIPNVQSVEYIFDFRLCFKSHGADMTAHTKTPEKCELVFSLNAFPKYTTSNYFEYKARRLIFVLSFYITTPKHRATEIAHFDNNILCIDYVCSV